MSLGELRPEEVEPWRAQLTANIANWRMQWRALDLERRGKEAMLRAAEASSLRAGKYKPRTDRGPMDMAAVGAEQTKHRLGEVENLMQDFEFAITEAEAELAALPAPESGGEGDG